MKIFVFFDQKHATMMTSVAFGFRTSYDSWYEQAEVSSLQILKTFHFFKF